MNLNDKYKHIPQDMKKLAQWVGFMRTPILKDGKPDKNADGTPRMSKIPIDVHTLGGASSIAVHSWGNFDEAMNIIGKTATVGRQRQQGTVEGVGFVFRPDKNTGIGICGIDLDHIIDPNTKQINAAAKEIIDTMDTYTEYSPSGTGVHMYYYGACHSEWEKKFNGCLGGAASMEMYQEKRYFTVTGNVFGELKPIRDREQQAAEIYKKYAPKPQEKTVTNKTVEDTYTTVLSDDKVIEKASKSKQGVKFMALLGGDLSDYGNDQSRADQALCNILAFWCSGDTKQIDRIFRNSGLMRKKWDEKRGATTYGERTILQAVNGCGSVYDPQYRQRQAIKEFTDIVPQGSTTIRDIAADTDPLPESDDYEERLIQIRELAKENALDGRIYKFCEEYLEDTEEIELFLEEYVRPCAKEQKRLSDFKEKSKKLLKKISNALKEKERAERRAAFAEKCREMEAQLPGWVWIDERGKRHLNEPQYMDEFAAKHQLKFFSGSFYEIDGFITELALSQKIQKELELYFTERIAQLTKRVVDGMKNRFFIEDMPPCAEKIHIQGGYITV